MGDTFDGPSPRAPEPAEELQDIRSLLWGPLMSETVFARWSQGFEFSPIEPTGLVQNQGGPCAVIAPVQAFLLRCLLADSSIANSSFSEVPKEKCRALLVQAITSILTQCKTSQSYRIVSVNRNNNKPVASDSETVAASHSQQQQQPANERIIPTASPQSPSPAASTAELVICEEADFHSRLVVTALDTPDQVAAFYNRHYEVLADRFGVLLLLYSVMLTRGVENIRGELNDVTEPLIDNTYGYGSQSLINLMLTGAATAHVFDNVEDVGGLRLQGIGEQSEIGFITLMEQLRYCTVGSFLKNPKSPVWVMGSETHLSVLFSDEPKLVSPETASEKAKRIFKSYDPDGNNFIQSEALQEILKTLDLVSEDEYVEIMKQKLDPEKLGIILLNAFMDEFFPEERRSVPDVFRLWHYNGIPGSNDGHQVKYNSGSAVLLESDLNQMVNNSDPMLMALQTKWPLIEVSWNGARTPSLN